jgi:hypothetical protein
MTIRSLKQHGYLMVDHRASPGLPEDIARNSGYDPKFAGEGKLFEADTLTCAHCKCAVIKNPFRTRERAKCSKCGYHYICDLCAAEMLWPDYSHTPYDKRVELVLNGVGYAQVPLGSPPALILPSTMNEEP